MDARVSKLQYCIAYYSTMYYNYEHVDFSYWQTNICRTHLYCFTGTNTPPSETGSCLTPGLTQVPSPRYPFLTWMAGHIGKHVVNITFVAYYVVAILLCYSIIQQYKYNDRFPDTSLSRLDPRLDPRVDPRVDRWSARDPFPLDHICDLHVSL